MNNKNNGENPSNQLAVKYLRFLNDEKPTQIQIEVMQSILTRTLEKKMVDFSEKLTKREKDCLYLASQGKSSKETAKFLCISSETVRVYRKEIIRKLQCKNMVQAVYKGIKYGDLFFL